MKWNISSDTDYSRYLNLNDIHIFYGPPVFSYAINFFHLTKAF